MLAFDQIRRSWLLVPLSQPQRLSTAPSAGADVVVLDLAEFVAEGDKPSAREVIRANLEPAKGGGSEVFVQIDPELMLADLGAAVWPGLNGVVITRVDSADQITQADTIISRLESQRGLLPGSVDLVAALETASGNHNGFDIANSSPRIWGLTLGRADLVMDLRPEPSGEIHLMPYLMQRLVTIAGAAGKVPLGAWWRFPDRGLLATPENTRAAARRGRAIGFKGSFCVLDEQVDPLNDGFTPSDQEVWDAQRSSETYTAATATGSATVAIVNGSYITPDLARQSTHTQTWARACAERERFKTAATEGRPVPLP